MKKAPDVKDPDTKDDGKKKGDPPDPKPDLPAGLELNPPEVYPGYPAGYLAKEELPDSTKLLLAPPAAGSPMLANDEAMRAAAQALKGKPRWTQAILDATMELPTMHQNFSCALGVPINPTDTPHLNRMLSRLLQDTGAVNSAVKAQHKRQRPFMVHNDEPCTPEIKEELMGDGSYPSGHATYGITIPLVLGEIAPERLDALMQRGRLFGEARMVCNVHWQTDVIQGRYTAGPLVAKLHTKPAFLADLVMAKKDIAAARAKNLPPSVDCAVEAANLSESIPGVM